ncbi:MAG: formylglycine-generating enzyme family protein [Oxalobacteraceae bacterium]
MSKDCADCPEMVALPAGRFTMGAPGKNAESAAQPAHVVNVKAFAIGKFEITQDEWFAIMGTRPAQFKGGRHPVEQVTWKLAREFTRKLSEKTGKKYRLPTEAEWEYAARGGTDSEWYLGQGVIADHAWFDDNSDETTHAVGQKKSNPHGLHDLYGNVWEWTEDCWNESYAGAPEDGSAWTTGDCGQRVVRGGTWYSKPASLGSSLRAKFSSEIRYSSRGGGLRVVREE